MLVTRLFSISKWYCSEVRFDNSVIIHYTIVFCNDFVENCSLIF